MDVTQANASPHGVNFMPSSPLPEERSVIKPWHGDINQDYPTDSSAELTLGYDISIQKFKKGEKPVLITLSKAVQAENARGTVAAAQKAGRNQKEDLWGWQHSNGIARFLRELGLDFRGVQGSISLFFVDSVSSLACFQYI
jgi:hypothetical protein